MIKTSNIYFSYDSSKQFAFPDIAFDSGGHCLIMGASGCGKTTLLHLIAGLLRPAAGQIIINDTDITALSNSECDAFRGKEIGMIFQKPHFVRWLTAFENIEISRYLNKLPNGNGYIDKLLDSLNLSEKRSSLPSRMSEGELQRLSIARAVANKPKLILADEPTSSLDDKNCEEALKLLKKQADELGASLVIVTHDKRLTEHFSNIILL